MKKVLVLGSGAQGTTVAKRLDEHPGVSEIIIADYDKKAVDELAAVLTKSRSVIVDAKDKDSIVAAAAGTDLIVNALPLDFAKNVLDAALEAGTDYQDFAAGYLTPESDQETEYWIRDINDMYNVYGPKFEAIGKLAVIGTGSAPGIVLVAARRAVRELDTCDTIYTVCYEGLETERFQPYWFSPETAFADMSDDAVAFIDGKLEVTEGFTLPIFRSYPELEGDTAMFVEHAHDEPVYIAHNADTFFKGCRNAYFKYGGVGINFAYPLKRAGLLSKKEEEINGRKVVPFDVILHHLPPAPKYREEIQAIIDEGIRKETGAMVAEAIGKKDGRDITAEVHVYSLGLEDSFRKYGMTSEMTLTGQGGFLYTKMLVEDKFDQKGLISSDMLTDEQVDYYLESAKEIDIETELIIRKD